VVSDKTRFAVSSRVCGGHRGIQTGADRRHLRRRCRAADSGRGLGNERTAIRRKAAVRGSGHRARGTGFRARGGFHRGHAILDGAALIALGASPVVFGAAFIADRGALARASLIAGGATVIACGAGIIAARHVQAGAEFFAHPAMLFGAAVSTLGQRSSCFRAVLIAFGPAGIADRDVLAGLSGLPAAGASPTGCRLMMGPLTAESVSRAVARDKRGDAGSHPRDNGRRGGGRGRRCP